MCCHPWGRKESDMTERLNLIKMKGNGIVMSFLLVPKPMLMALQLLRFKKTTPTPHTQDQKLSNCLFLSLASLYIYIYIYIYIYDAGGGLFKGTNHLSSLFFQDLDKYYPIRSPMYVKTFSSSYILGKQTKKGEINFMWLP